MIAYDPEKITFFAKTDARGQQVPFGIKAKDRQRHMYVIGKTGMGKSTLLENMAAQDIQSGEGMAFIDPHGSAIETLLEYVPENRLDDVVYFAPFDMENPIGFNIMEDVGVDTRHLVVSGLMSTFKKIWEDAWSARMEYILTNALLALIEYPGTTLLSVNRMLADKKYRDKVIENVKDPAVKAYWIDEFNNYTERFAAEALPAIQNKIGQFTGNPLIRNIIGQPHSSFDVRKMMDEKKILLINLSKGLVGETNADLIGSMLITKIYLAAMSRADLPPAQMKLMPNFYFYVDEFQSFANSTFANILSEARKYHLNLIIAHQYVAQMEEKIRDAVFGNVGTTIAFRTGPFDAEVLETVFAPQFEATDLVNLGFAQIYLSLMIDGVGSQPFSAVTLPPVKTPQVSHKQMVIKRSQKNFTRPRSEVEQAVVDSHAPVERIETAVENGSGNKGGFAKPSGWHKVGADQKGPPKKNNNQPNGNQNGNQNSNNNGNRPKPAAKTAEDLKDILAGMTGQNNQPKPPTAKDTNDDNKPTPPAANQAKESAPAKLKEQTPQTKLSEQTEQTEQTKLPESTPSTQSPDNESKKPTPVDNQSGDKDAQQKPQNRNTESAQQSSRSNTNQLKSSEAQAKPNPNSSNQNRNQQRPQPQHKQTTPDDLRAILAKMTGKIEANKAQANTGNKPNENLRSNANANRNVGRQNGNTNGNSNQPKPSSNEQPALANPVDLRNVLQSMVANKNQEKNSSNQTKSAPTNKTDRPASRMTPQSTDNRQDLQAALSQAVKRPSVEASENRSAPAPAPRPAPPSNQIAAPAAPKPAPTTSPTPTPVSTSQATDPYKQSADPAIGGIRQPAYVPHVQSSGPDIKIAKQMLRHSGKERPPGT